VLPFKYSTGTAIIHWSALRYRRIEKVAVFLLRYSGGEKNEDQLYCRKIKDI
jgi:hypothetical protein